MVLLDLILIYFLYIVAKSMKGQRLTLLLI